MKRFSCNVCGAAVVVLLAGSMSAAATEVTLGERVVCKSPVVRLGDVAVISAADGAEQQRLAGLLLMPAPAPGTQRYVRQREIQDMLAARGEDLAQFRFAGASQTAVVSPAAVSEVSPGSGENRTMNRHAVLLAGQMKRTSAASLDELEAEQAQGRVKQLIVDYLAAKAGRADAWRVTSNVADRFLAMLQTATSAPNCTGGEEPWTGRQRFVISFETAKGPVPLPIYADVALATPVVVAIRPIERGAVITAAHVEMHTVDYVPSQSDRRVPVESVENLIGMEARQAIKAGDIVYSDEVRAPLLVKRGEVITVTSQGGGIRVRTTARARQDGARGDLVQVETLDTKERYDARVVGTRAVAVFAATRVADMQPTFERSETAWRQGK